MDLQQNKHDPFAVLKLKEVRFFIGTVALGSLANRALIVVIGYQIYQLTHSALALGILGLVEAIPAISLSLFGGYVADHSNRRRILLVTKTISTVCAILLGLISLDVAHTNVLALYGVIFIAGLARGFSDPAHTAFEAQVVPKELTVNAATWISSAWISTSIIGPVLAGFSYAIFGPSQTYFFISIFFALSWISIAVITPKPQIMPKDIEPLFQSIATGIRFVFKEQILIGSMCLDLFAVLFGGAVALLPIFADDILHVGAKGLGFLNAAPAAGALLIMLWSTRHPPIKNAGRNLLLCVAGFGVSIIIFAFSKNFFLSLAALLFSGIFDGVSMVIRRSIVRLLSPDDMRGRVASVSWIFIGASNEIGAFESGVVAHLIGTIPCVWAGGVVTLIVVAITAVVAPKLRRLSLDPESLKSMQASRTT